MQKGSKCRVAVTRDGGPRRCHDPCAAMWNRVVKPRKWIALGILVERPRHVLANETAKHMTMGPKLGGVTFSRCMFLSRVLPAP